MGSIMALYNIGRHYQYGYFVDQNYDIALSYFRKAAALNESRANILLGFAYSIEDLGLKKDLEKAKEYYFKEYEIGNVDAIQALAEIHVFESDDKLDVVNGIETLKRLAVDDENPDAKINLILLTFVEDTIYQIKKIYPEYKPDPELAFPFLIELIEGESDDVELFRRFVNMMDIFDNLSKNKLVKSV